MLRTSEISHQFEIVFISQVTNYYGDKTMLSGYFELLKRARCLQVHKKNIRVKCKSFKTYNSIVVAFPKLSLDKELKTKTVLNWSKEHKIYSSSIGFQCEKTYWSNSLTGFVALFCWSSQNDFKLANSSLVRVFTQVKMLSIVKGQPLLRLRISPSVLNAMLAGRPS